MGDFITGLATAVTASNLWGAIAPAASLVGVGIIVGFGYTVIRRSVRGLGKGKGTL